ncbi:L-threonylcarbamoyladenylate synthase [Isoptericola chiayiensis]|uniref:L-threonylcarbamoyladenylate synthase n=1 Tax=Isoptericola chiayiensis TaxID=579446 RepID=A0ABP8YH04_9MICO|nr:L-threonylcarbamoyladenylate synthase [Isoptericola chiayiensis]NOV99932.1 tRNA threonylcarbamoyl adenosine modification protein (Sua5/YciO/YrdC/YwlC family) [Isoptericola chiayiensis]
MARVVDIHPVDPQPRLVSQVADVLREGGLIAYPTDSGYALGCRCGQRDGTERIRQIRRLDAKHHFTLVCASFAQMGQLVRIDNSAFRAIKAATPGPYTFILPATEEVPRRLAHPKKKTVGVRIPESRTVHAILDELGEPLLSSTLILPGDDGPLTQGWQVDEAVGHAVDLVVDAEDVPAEPTTVVDFSAGYPEVARVGAGDPEPFS